MQRKDLETKQRKKEASSFVSQNTSSVMLGRSAWTRRSTSGEAAEEGSMPFKGARIKGRDDWYGVIKVYRETREWVKSGEELQQ